LYKGHCDDADADDDDDDDDDDDAAIVVVCMAYVILLFVPAKNLEYLYNEILFLDSD
jgi:hypothetical protein